MIRPPLLLAAVLALVPAGAFALCTSDGVPQPRAVLDRFISADCDTCWQDPQTPTAGTGTLALDWVLPGTRGDDAPLATVASNDAADRLQALGLAPPTAAASRLSNRQPSAARLRLALGNAFNDYIGASIALKPPGRGGWDAWLILLETLPAGTEGSPVTRNLVRNVFRPVWTGSPARGARELADMRAMQIREGAQPDRLRLVGLLHDRQGRLVAATVTDCKTP